MSKHVVNPELELTVRTISKTRGIPPETIRKVLRAQSKVMIAVMKANRHVKVSGKLALVTLRFRKLRDSNKS